MPTLVSPGIAAHVSANTANVVGLDADLAAEELFLTSGQARIPAGWEQVVVDPSPLAWTIRRQIADVSSLGERRFVVAYIVQDLADTSQARGEIRYARFDVEAGFRSPPVRTGERASWVRAATGDPIRQGTCGSQVAASRLPQPEVEFEFGSPNYVSFFSYGLQDDNVRRAKLMRHSWCGKDFKTTYHDVGAGTNPSVAVGRYAGQIKLLVVYGQGNKLVGRFFDTAAMAIGSEFQVASFPEGFAITSTDVIWNAVAQRYIVGFIRNGGLAGGCTVNNVRITWDGESEEPVRRGFCDPETGGHHTSVAYDSRSLSNPDGLYAWWYEGEREGAGTTKALRLMDANGNPTGFRADLVQNALTFPVAARREKDQNLVGLIPGSYMTASTVSPSTPGEKRMAGWTFDPDGSTRRIGLVTPEHCWQVALETLEVETVLLWRQCMNEGECSWWAPWRITVFSHFQPALRVARPDL